MTIRDVTAYGAVADDSTDNATAFRAAVAAMVAGDILYIPGAPKAYRTTTTLCPFRITGQGVVDFEIRGDGIGSSVIKYTSIPGDGLGDYWNGMCFSIESSLYGTFMDGIYFHDLTLWDLSETFATDYVAACWMRYIKNVNVRNVEVINPKGGAIALYGSFGHDNLSLGTNYIQNTHVHTIGDTGLSNTSGCICGGFKNMTIRNNTWEGRLARGGFEGGYHEDLIVEDNVGLFRDVTDLVVSAPQQSGLYSIVAQGGNIRRNYIRLDSTGTTGIMLAADAQTLPSRNVNIYNNRVYVRDPTIMYPLVIQGNNFGAGAGGEDVDIHDNYLQGLWSFYPQLMMMDGRVKFRNNTCDYMNSTSVAEVVQGWSIGGNGLAFQTNSKLEIRDNNFINMREPTYTIPGTHPVRWAVWANAVTDAAKIIIENNNYEGGHYYSSYTGGYGGNTSEPAPEGIFPAESYGTLTIGNITAGASSASRTVTMRGVLSTDTIECMPDKALPAGITVGFTVGTGTFDWWLKNNTAATVNVPANAYRFWAHRANLW